MGLLIIYFLTTSNLLKTVSTLTIKQTVVNNDIINIVISLILTLKSGNKLAPSSNVDNSTDEGNSSFKENPSAHNSI